ncbi:putative CRISPR-associated protein (TIGR02619 family) [Geobacillus sp. C56-T2]|nr:putative CRISPR-associated protein (TIGR02619 family) [Geobacillus sp. C56-T2]
MEKTRLRNLPWDKYERKNPVYVEPTSDQMKVFTRYNQDLLSYRSEDPQRNNMYQKIDDKFSHYIQKIVDAYKQQIKQHSWPNWTAETWRLMPAEVSSTMAMVDCLVPSAESPFSDVRLVLFVSDTVQAHLSACVIEKMFEDIGFRRENIERVRIERFQMEDIQVFAEEGLPNFIRHLKDRIDVNDTDNQWLNITGGYKNFIPLVTHIASFYGLDMYYVFEEAIVKGKDALVKIPRIPTLNHLLGANESIVSTILSILNDIEKGEYGSTPKEVWKNIDSILYCDLSLPSEVAEIFVGFINSFIDVSEGEFKLSTIGRVYMELFKSR